MIPEGWVQAPVKDYGDVCAGRQRSPHFKVGSLRPYLRVANVFEGHIDTSDVNEMLFSDSEFKKYRLEIGDILLNEGQSAELVGRPAMYKGKPEECCFQNTLVRFRAGEDVDRDFSLQLFLFCLHTGKFRAISKQTTSIAHLGVSRFANMELLWPSVPEQKKIAHILSTWDKAISTTEKLLANSQQQKKGLMQKLLSGQSRLLNKSKDVFGGEWKFLSFDAAFKVVNKKSAQVKSSDYLSFGAVPIVDQGQKLIVGYCNREELYTEIPVIVFGDHTRCLKWVDFVFCPGADGTQLLNAKEPLDKKFGYYSLAKLDIPNLGYSRHMRELKQRDFRVPIDPEEQQKIATVLTCADNEITTLQKKLAHLKQEKKALMQQLLTGKRRVKIDAGADQ